MNWVEQRAEAERWLRIRGPQLWADLQSAMERAVESFSKHYGEEWAAEFIRPADDDCVRIHLIPHKQQRPRSLELRYRIDGKGRHGIWQRGAESPSVTIEATSTEGRFALGEKSLTTDKASQALLEPFLFPDSSSADRTAARTSISTL